MLSPIVVGLSKPIDHKFVRSFASLRYVAGIKCQNSSLPTSAGGVGGGCKICFAKSIKCSSVTALLWISFSPRNVFSAFRYLSVVHNRRLAVDGQELAKVFSCWMFLAFIFIGPRKVLVRCR
tara:strand:+ start:173 stop:538 length:366 start_codon:yes stop_codon:yes gene_type:complete